MATTCPDGHRTEATDYCDICGLSMNPSGGRSGHAGQTSASGGAAGHEGEASSSDGGSGVPGEGAGSDPVLPPPEAGPVAEGEVGRCPSCGTPRREGDAFCEVCGLDYATGRLPATPAPGSTPAPAAAAEQPPSAPAGPGWEVEVVVDPDWFAAQEAEEGGLELPPARAPVVVPLTGAMVAVGRRSEADGWYPGVDLGHVHDDPGVSRRHGELVAVDDGWAYVDTGSTNGSTVDGTAVAADDAVPVRDGTTIHLGAWTRLVVRRRDEQAEA